MKPKPKPHQKLAMVPKKERQVQSTQTESWWATPMSREEFQETARRKHPTANAGQPMVPQGWPL